MTDTTRIYRNLRPGDRFYSPRPEEGAVTVVCAPGRCDHDRSRDEFGCHVRGSGGGSFFVNAIPDEPVRLVPALPAFLSPAQVIDPA